LKLILKVLLGGIGLFLFILILVQLPPVQKFLTGKAELYLEEKSGGEVTIEKIAISLSGNVVVEGVQLCTPERDCNIRIGALIVKVDPIALLRGQIDISYLNLSSSSMRLKLAGNGTSLDYLINAFSPETPIPKDNSSVPDPLVINSNEIYVSDTDFYLEITNSLDLHAWVGDFSSSEVAVGLYPNFIKVGNAEIINSGCDIMLYSSDQNIKPNTTDTLVYPELPGYRFFSGFDFDISSLAMRDGSFTLHKDTVDNVEKFNPYHMSIKDIDFNVSEVIMEREDFAANISDLSLQSSPFEIQDLDISAKGSDTTLQIDYFHVETAKSSANLQVATNFTNIKKLLKEINQNQTQITLSSTINIKEIEYFVPIPEALSLPEELEIKMKADGNTELATIKQLDMKSSSDSIQISGNIGQWLTKNIQWRGVKGVGFLNAKSGYISQFANNLNLPPQINLQANTSGSLDSLDASVNAWSTWGESQLDGTLVFEDEYRFSISASSSRFDLSPLAGNEIGEEASIELSASGSYGEQLQLQSEGEFRHLKAKGINLENIQYQLDFSDDLLDIEIESLDPKAIASANILFDFKDTLKLETDISLEESNLAEVLKLPSNTYTGFDLQSSHAFSTNLEYISGELNVQNATFYSRTDSISIDTLWLYTDINPSSTTINLESEIASGFYTSNFGLSEAYDFANDYLRSITRAAPIPELAGKQADLQLNLSNTQGLEILGYPISGFEKLSINSGISSTDKTIYARLDIQNVGFQELSAETISLRIEDPMDTVFGSLNINNIQYDSLNLASFQANLVRFQDQINASLSIYDSATTYMNVQSRVVETDQWSIWLDSVNTYYGNLAISQKEPISVTENILIPEIRLRRRQQQFILGKTTDSLYVKLENYDLSELTKFIHYDSLQLFAGRIDAALNYNLTKGQFEASTNISNLSVLGAPAVSITGSAHKQNAEVLFGANVSGKQNNGKLEGSYNVNNQEISAHLTSDISNYSILNPLFKSRITNASGRIISDLNLSGRIDNPELSGYIALQDFAFRTSKPQLSLSVAADSILFDQKGVHFDKFALLDQKKNEAIIDGYLNTTDYRDFFYDLTIKSDRFLLLDNPKVKENIIQGQLYTGLDMRFKGSMENTRVDATITIDDLTDIAYFTPPEDIELVSAQGVVQFVEPEQMFDTTFSAPTDANLYEIIAANLPGFNLNSRLVIEDGALLKVVVDPRSGDYLQVNSNADLYFGFDKNGEISIDGIFNISRGKYELSFYNIVKKGFDITPGSAVSWSGSVEQGELNIEAVHTVLASSISLVGHEIGENERTIYNRSLPYEIGINIRGTLTEPSVFFTLDLPARERSNYPVLDNKLSRLAQPEFQGELNKQVFSLLVLGGFLPETTGIDESTIATTAIANSVNSILSSQLNRLTGQYIKGVDIDLGMSSYADFGASGGGQTRTAVNVRLRKSLANDRLTIEAGGSFDVNSNLPGSNNFRGDVAIIYDLTENGNKQLKAFNNETYDIIYHEVRNTGLALIFIKEFDSKRKEQRE